MSKYVVFDRDSVVSYDGDTVTLRTVKTFDDPHEAGFYCRKKWSYDFVRLK